MTHRVLIVGGGFGGLAAAKALKRAPVAVTLVDRADHHLFQPHLYRVAAGAAADRARRPLAQMLRGQDFVQAEVTGIDLRDRRVNATSARGEPHTLGYDSLIVAAGAGGGLKTLEDAHAVRVRVWRALARAAAAEDEAERAAWSRFAIVGGGQTGVELAAAIAEVADSARVSVLEAGPRLLPAFPAPLRLRAARELAALGVDVWLRARAIGADSEGVDLAGDLRLPARTVIWATGGGASPLAEALAEASGAPVDGYGRIAVEHDLTLRGHPEAFAVGDMAALAGVPDLAPAAVQAGRHAARTIRRRLAGEETRRFRYVDQGRLASIGRRRALGTWFGVRLAGPPARLAWARHLAPLKDLSSTARTT